MIKLGFGKQVLGIFKRNEVPKHFFSSARINLEPYATHLLDPNALPKEAEITREEGLKYYYDMQMMRRMEIACDNLYKNQEIRGFCHLYDGQEAVLMGIEAALTMEDCMITAYRDHCHAYTRGYTVEQIIAEMMGKVTGATHGKGGSMHYYSHKNRFYGGNGIVGAQIPVGAGLAFAQKYLGKKNVTIAMYGDGAANQGQLFEAANMAGLWDLPVIFICENNNYGMGTSTQRAANHPHFYSRDPAIPGLKVDGHKVLHVREALKWAKKYVLEKGPLFIEASTYRYHGHSMSDPGISYRTREEIAKIRQERDALELLKRLLLEKSLATEAELKDIERKTKDEVEQATEKARAAPLPDAKELYADVYVNNSEHYLRGVENHLSYIPGGKKL